MLRDASHQELHRYDLRTFFFFSVGKAEEAAKKGPECVLKNRILFHVSHKLLDENKLMVYHQRLTDTNEDQLSLAAIHYLRSHFQEVSDRGCRLSCTH